MSAMDEIVKFQVDRKLHKKQYIWENECGNIVEEMFEAIGIHDRDMAHDITRKWGSAFPSKIALAKTEDAVDAFADIIVFATGAIMKLGYDPRLVLEEVGKEINSRTGKFEDGKFIKDTSEEAKKKWYKADFTKCKYVEVTPDLREWFFDQYGFMGTDFQIAQAVRKSNK